MTIILVHGLWGAADHWHGVLESLKLLGVTDVVTVELPRQSLYHAVYCADLYDEAAVHLLKTGRNPSASIMGEEVS